MALTTIKKGMFAVCGRPTDPSDELDVPAGGRKFKCAVLGATGGIGQPLALLLKLNPRVKELVLYDVSLLCPGVAADISHIATGAKVTSFVGDDLRLALTGCEVVMIVGGVARQPGMTRDDLLEINAGIVSTLAEGCAQACPSACILLVTNPVNSLVPVAAEVLKRWGVFDARKLFGITALDACRARAFYAEVAGLNPLDVKVPVVGGHAGATIVPLFSQAEPPPPLAETMVERLTHRVMTAGEEVVQAKAGQGSATLSMAHAGAEFADRVMAGLAGEIGVTEVAFVHTSKVEGTSYFSLPVTLGKDGVETTHHYGMVSTYEKKLIQDMMPELIEQIKKGIEWTASPATSVKPRPSSRLSRLVPSYS